jgi:putative flippase GtrA
MALTSSFLTLVKLILRFLVSGGIATAVHWSALWALVTMQVDAVWASGIGAFLGAIVNYFSQYFFTFKTKSGHKQALLAYIPSVALSWLLNLGIFYSLYMYLLSDPLWAQVVTTGIVMVVNFLLYKKVVFRDKFDT